MKKQYINLFVLLLVVLLADSKIAAQQDAQYTQYMYNPMSINPAYVGSRNALSFVGLYRTQWVGLKGAPTTFTFSGHSPIANRMGLGLNVTQDEVFVTNETNIDLAYSYNLPLSNGRNLAFGIKGGAHLLNVDFLKARSNDVDALLTENIDNKFSPQVGIGLFYYTKKWYAGLSVPNMLETEHFDSSTVSSVNTNLSTSELARERINYYAMGGYIYEVNNNITLKPTALVKWVDGAPLQVDITANALFYNKFILGAAYRWDAAVSAMAGFQISDRLLLGMAYDRETTELVEFNDGSYEFFLRYEFFKKKSKLVHPRFF